jgi:hypothetical protein
MGKRRDRRHAAALGGGGRRMKLDLWNDDDAEKLSTNGAHLFLFLFISHAFVILSIILDVFFGVATFFLLSFFSM